MEEDDRVPLSPRKPLEKIVGAHKKFEDLLDEAASLTKKKKRKKKKHAKTSLLVKIFTPGFTVLNLCLFVCLKCCPFCKKKMCTRPQIFE
jgi:hypothetical protein